MKAAFLIGPEKIVLREAPEPDAPPDGLVLRMGACGVCGSDLRRWLEGPPSGAGFIIPGHELAGTVAECGSAVTQFKTGDRLAVAPDIHCGECYYCRRGLYNLCVNLRLLGITPGLDGGFAEKVVLTGELLRNGIVHQMPGGLSFEEGGLAETLSSVLASQTKCGVSLGETVVVMGAGPIGCLHIVVARARGAQVIVVEPNPVRRQRAGRFAVKAVVDPTTHLDGNLIHYGELRVVGAFSYHPGFHEAALRLLARKVIQAEPFLTHTRPLSKVAEAFDIARSGEALKVMVVPD